MPNLCSSQLPPGLTSSDCTCCLVNRFILVPPYPLSEAYPINQKQTTKPSIIDNFSSWYILGNCYTGRYTGGDRQNKPQPAASEITDQPDSIYPELIKQ